MAYYSQLPVNRHCVTNTFPRQGLSYIFNGEEGMTFTAARLKTAVLLSFISQQTIHAEVNEESAESNCLGIS